MQIDTSLSISATGYEISPSSRSSVSGTAATATGTDSIKSPASSGTLGEISSAPPDEALETASLETAVLKENAGSGNIPVQMAAAIYTLNLSFDLPKDALNLLA